MTNARINRQLSDLSLVSSNGSLSDSNGYRKDSVELSPTVHEKTLYPGQKRKKTKFQRVRKRTNTLLHTHIALILVCVLSSLDAVCVIGQVICDILIMSDKLADYDDLHETAESVLVPLLPQYLNTSDHWTFKEIVERLEEVCNTQVDCQPHAHAEVSHSMTDHFAQFLALGHGVGISERKISPAHHRARRAAGGDEHAEHDLLHELTHSFHIGSMVLLSILLAETFLKIFAMWKSFLHHKLEVFDAFVITVSWCLDVALWEGIWARPGQEGATLLIFILPWRVIRIVNSFVLVIQEKDLVLLKVAKQRLRSALRKVKECQLKLDKYRLEIRQLQGLCRKRGADEASIQACCPAGKRRRSSLFQSLASLASVAFISAMGSANDLGDNRVSSSESESEEGDSPEVTSPVSFTLSPDTGISTISGQSNAAFTFDEESLAKYSNTTELNNGPDKERYWHRNFFIPVMNPMVLVLIIIVSSRRFWRIKRNYRRTKTTEGRRQLKDEDK